jgi:hypothetical protein
MKEATSAPALARVARRSSAVGLLAIVTFADLAQAAPEWVDRSLTLRQFGIAIDAGIALAHAEGADVTGGGLNLEAGFGILDSFEIGLRSGARLGDQNAKTLQVDQYARLFDLETYGTGTALFANPELRLLGRILDLSVLELGVEGRLYLPVEDRTRFSFMLGAPVRLHVARILRIDTGLYVPVLSNENGAGGTISSVSLNLPAEFWFQVTRRVFLGPVAEFRVNGNEAPLGFDRGTGLLFGFGMGYQISRFADLKLSLVLPRVNGDPGPDIAFGTGLGLHFD